MKHEEYHFNTLLQSPLSTMDACELYWLLLQRGKSLTFRKVNRVTHVMGIVGADSTYHFIIADHAIGCTMAIYSM